MQILLGNNAPHETDGGAVADVRDADGNVLQVGQPVIRRLLDPVESSITTVVVPDDKSVAQLLIELDHLWKHHSSQLPGWVTVRAEDPAVAQAALAAIKNHFNLPDVEGPVALLTNAGRDVVAAQVSGAASATAVAKWIALTANATAPAAGDTTLTGEITTAGGGLVRATATYAHTGGASTYTLTHTFTANGSDSLPVTVHKIGVFDASSSGNLVYETVLSADATLNASGDNIPLTETVTIS